MRERSLEKTDTRNLVRQPEIISSLTAEGAYDRLILYRFARRHAEGRSVALVSSGEVGEGACLLAETADSVTGLTGSPEALELARDLYPATGVSYERCDLPYLSGPENRFDVVIVFDAIERLERPEDLLKEAKRTLRPGGILIVSTPDKQAHSNDRNRRDPSHRREMYIPELREVLEKRFEQVFLYRQGAVAGALVHKLSDDLSAASVESAVSTATSPSFGNRPPDTRFILAVCGDHEAPIRENEEPYVLLDLDRRVFDESDDRHEDVELLWAEIQQIQQTEVQAFQDAMKIRNSEISYLRAQLKRSEARLEKLETHLRNIENSRTWQALGVYRKVRIGLNDRITNWKAGGNK